MAFTNWQQRIIDLENGESAKWVQSFDGKKEELVGNPILEDSPNGGLLICKSGEVIPGDWGGNEGSETPDPGPTPEPDPEPEPEVADKNIGLPAAFESKNVYNTNYKNTASSTYTASPNDLVAATLDCKYFPTSSGEDLGDGLHKYVIDNNNPDKVNLIFTSLSTGNLSSWNERVLSFYAYDNDTSKDKYKDYPVDETLVHRILSICSSTASHTYQLFSSKKKIVVEAPKNVEIIHLVLNTTIFKDTLKNENGIYSVLPKIFVYPNNPTDNGFVCDLKNARYYAALFTQELSTSTKVSVATYTKSTGAAMTFQQEPTKKNNVWYTVVGGYTGMSVFWVGNSSLSVFFNSDVIK